MNTNPSRFSHERRRSLTYLTYKSMTKLAHDFKVPYFPSMQLEHSEVSEGTVFYVLYKVILLCLLESLSKSKSGWSPHSLRIQTMEQCCIVIHIIAAYRGASAPRRTDGFPHHQVYGLAPTKEISQHECCYFKLIYCERVVLSQSIPFVMKPAWFNYLIPQAACHVPDCIYLLDLDYKYCPDFQRDMATLLTFTKAVIYNGSGVQFAYLDTRPLAW